MLFGRNYLASSLGYYSSPWTSQWHVKFGSLHANFPAPGINDILLLVFVVLAVRTIIYLFICSAAARALRCLPHEYRKISQEQVWLLMIPGLPYVWFYRVFPTISQGYQRYLAALGDNSYGDCGAWQAWAMCICCDATLVPWFTIPAYICYLVLLLNTVFNLSTLEDLRQRAAKTGSPNSGTVPT